MTRARLLAAASALVLLGCSNDFPVSPDAPFNPGKPELTGITGRVVADPGFGQQGIHLQEPSGGLILLHGTEAQRLASVDGADVIVRGYWIGGGQPLANVCLLHEHESPATWDTAAVFTVDNFTVLAVAGRSAIDGVVVEADGFYGVRLGGDVIYWFDDPPSDLMALVGERIWVTGTTEEAPLTFGVIPAAF